MIDISTSARFLNSDQVASFPDKGPVVDKFNLPKTPPARFTKLSFTMDGKPAAPFYICTHEDRLIFARQTEADFRKEHGPSARYTATSCVSRAGVESRLYIEHDLLADSITLRIPTDSPALAKKGNLWVHLANNSALPRRAIVPRHVEAVQEAAGLLWELVRQAGEMEIEIPVPEWFRNKESALFTQRSAAGAMAR